MTENRRKSKQVNFRLPDALAERFEGHCKERGITMTQFLENSIRLALGEPLAIPVEILNAGNPAISPDDDVNQRLANLEERLASIATLEQRIEQLASQQASYIESLGELAA
ncbi:hypothetical protein [Coleofasciculus sp. FACHB-SPT9]|uniref:hypothetical protein n=1 Tax=Cyanophyceae TaxID=3028117 RepID=UPI00168744DC|nr:hypothetical protein [Coleofasciculus sp. FACHB-SPT9]MBD1890482.1 hypothetical protein [Coleofasciculus sp. FACHB-SPT9]